MKHTLTEVETGYACAVCGLTWKHRPVSECPGVPVYAWGQWPDHLLTQKQLGAAGYQTGQKLPSPAAAVLRAKSPDGIMWLYDPADGVPKRAMSETQKAALAKAQHMSERIGLYCARCGGAIKLNATRKQAEARQGEICQACINDEAAEYQAGIDRAEAITWAREMLRRRDVVVLDTETTSLDGEVIQIGIIDLGGNVLLDTLLKPLDPVSEGARAVHGITDEQLAGAPTLSEVYPELARVLAGKTVLVYNAEFDYWRLTYTCRRHKCDERILVRDRWDCLMEWYAQYVGDLHPYYRTYRWQPLDGDHDAVGDCRAALARLREMAKTEGDSHA